MRTLGLVLLLAATLAAQERRGAAMKIESSAFAAGQPIPQKYTCQGEDVSPPLAWSGAPAAAKAFALIVDDPDAPVGTWVHWVLYDLPAGAASLPEGVPPTDRAAGGLQGKNDFKRMGYGGPCPPPGKPHRYFFKLYALDKALGLPPASSKAEVEKAMQGRVLAQGELMGTYQRK